MTMLHLREDGSWFLSLFEYVPHEFWPYTSYVTDRIIVTDWRSSGPANDLRDELLRRFKEADIECHLDNKIVFGLKEDEGGNPNNPSRMIYVGFYDGQMTVGLGFRTDEWNLKRAAERKK